MKTGEIKKLSSAELEEKIIEIQRSLFELRFKQATKQELKTHLIKKYKRTLAQVLTAQHSLKNKP